MMDWAEDFKFLKKSAKKGRRSENSTTTATIANLPTVESSSINDKPSSGGTSSSSNKVNITSDDVDEYTRPQRMRRTGGWADEGLKTLKSGTNVIEQERFNSTSDTTHFSDDDIPIIPDLDDIQDELLMNELVEAPILAENRTATYKELDSVLLKQAAFTAMEDVDLSTLGRCLQPENELNEPDEEWNWDKLFTEISSDIHADKPKSSHGPTMRFVN